MQTLKSHFRDQLIAASLKLLAENRNGNKLCNFRDQLIAASLKSHRDKVISLSQYGFPRSIDRGLIEVSLSNPNNPIVADFRDQLIAASLKWYSKKWRIYAKRDFRDQLIAASLKSMFG